MFQGRSQGKSWMRQYYLKYLQTAGELISDTEENGVRHEIYRLPNGRKVALVSPAINTPNNIGE